MKHPKSERFLIYFIWIFFQQILFSDPQFINLNDLLTNLTENERQYFIENVSRQDVNSEIDRIQNNKEINLSSSIRSNILVEYFLTEYYYLNTNNRPISGTVIQIKKIGVTLLDWYIKEFLKKGHSPNIRKKFGKKLKVERNVRNLKNDKNGFFTWFTWLTEIFPKRAMGYLEVKKINEIIGDCDFLIDEKAFDYTGKKIVIQVGKHKISVENCGGKCCIKNIQIKENRTTRIKCEDCVSSNNYE